VLLSDLYSLYCIINRNRMYASDIIKLKDYRAFISPCIMTCGGGSGDSNGAYFSPSTTGVFITQIQGATLANLLSTGFTGLFYNPTTAEIKYRTD
jgi:hypothetical protein